MMKLLPTKFIATKIKTGKLTNKDIPQNQEVMHQRRKRKTIRKMNITFYQTLEVDAGLVTGTAVGTLAGTSLLIFILIIMIILLKILIEG